MEKHPAIAVPTLYFDGQFIDVLWDNHEHFISWFGRYFGWKVRFDDCRN